MALIFLVAGVVFAWLVKRAWMWCHGWFGTTPTRRTTWRQVIVYWIAFALFAVFVAIFVIGEFGRLTGHWSWDSVVALEYFTTREVQGLFIAFFAGVVIYLLRVSLAEFWLKIYRALCAQLAGPSHGGGVVAAPPATGGAGEAPKESHPWLVTIFGASTAVLAGVLIVLTFFPDVLTHVESIKVAGLEARFATAATKSVRIAVQGQRGPVRTSTILNRWRTFERVSSQIFLPAQDVVSRRSSQDIDADRVRIGGEKFLEVVAQPFAQVAGCFSEHYNIRDTEYQGSAARAANDWSELFLAIARSQGANDELENAVAETFDLMFRLDRDLAERKLKCNGSTDPWVRIYPSVRCDPNCQEDTAAASVVARAVDKLRPYLAAIPAYGYSIGFVSDLKLWGSEYKNDDLDFLNEVAPYLNGGRRTLIAQLNFYFTRAQIKFTSRVSSQDTIDDYKRAVSLVDDLLAAIDAEIQDEEKAIRNGASGTPAPGNASGSVSDPDTLRRVQAHYRGVRAIFYNGELYTLIVDWLEGRKLLPAELEALEGLPTGGLARELSGWIDGQSVSELRDRAAARDLFASTWLAQIADTDDTLAMRELAIAAQRNDISKERCARAFEFLGRAQDMSHLLNRPDLTENYRAHRDLYDSACSP